MCDSGGEEISMKQMSRQASRTWLDAPGRQHGYIPVGDEVEIFAAAWESGLSVMLKGPTGCGKTRLVEHMANQLGVPLFTVSCHEDMTASDLLGRFVLRESNTEWVDGPLTRAVREGGICYLDEVVEARQDAVVAVHSLADHRRELNIERLGGVKIHAAEGFQLVVSYNPGYQSVLKEAIRRLDDPGLREAASTRTLVATASLVQAGLSPRTAAVSAIASSLSDDEDTQERLTVLIESYLQ